MLLLCYSYNIMVQSKYPLKLTILMIMISNTIILTEFSQ